VRLSAIDGPKRSGGKLRRLHSAALATADLVNEEKLDV
jgi:hypothetical protein